MEKQLYMILVVASRVAGLFICVSNCLAILTGSLWGIAGNMPMRGMFTFALILNFALGALLLFTAKPIAKALTSNLE